MSVPTCSGVLLNTCPPVALPALPAPPTGFLLAQQGSGLWVALGLAGSVGLSSSGFVLQTCGFKEGSAGEWAWSLL